MKTARLCAALAWLPWLSAPAVAADLAKVDRGLVKEPAYRTNRPRYGLLVFGPEAKTRAWLVLDGDTLYLDRNGNGDLTEPGERLTVAHINKELSSKFLAEGRAFVDRVHPEKATWASADRDKAITLKGTTRYSRFSVHHFVVDNDRAPRTKQEEEEKRAAKRDWDGFVDVYVTIDRKLAQRGRARFAARPREAPIIHLGGPLGFQLAGPAPKIQAGAAGLELRVRLAAPGLGEGAETSLRDFNVVPKDVHPTAEIEFPPKKPGGAPLRITAPLKQRC